MSADHDDSNGGVEELVEAFLERRETEPDLAPEDFARGVPDASPRLLAALRAAIDVDRMLAASEDELGEDLAAIGAVFEGRGPLLARPGDLPERIGPFDVMGEIGRGGMGRVLRVRRATESAEGNDDEPELALKLLHATAVHNERAVERFRREGEALQRLQHPNVVRVLEVDVVGNTPYIAMERVDGVSLRDFAKDGETGELPGQGDRASRAAKIVLELADAVAAAHAAGILHRDLKPSNVLLTRTGTPVLIDFGLGRFEGEASLTGTGDAIGTPHYMAPEQARGEPADERTDIFGLGAILFELLTARPPRSGDDTLGVLRAASGRPVEVLHARRDGVPAALAHVLERALAFRSRWRHASARELAADLERFLEGREASISSPSFLQRGDRFWLAHKRAIVAAAATVFAAVLVWALFLRADESAFQERVVQARRDVLVAWLDGDRDAATRAAQEHAELVPDDMAAGLLQAMAEGEELDAPSSAPISALDRGLALRRAGRHDEALRQFQTGFDTAPASEVTVLLMAVGCYEVGDFERAEFYLTRVARPLFASREIHRYLARTYTALGQWEDAVRAAQNAKALAPDDPEVEDELQRALAALAEADVDGSD